MDGTKTSLKTLIGLPIILVVASGIAFGAARLSDSLSTQSAKMVDDDTSSIDQQVNQEQEVVTDDTPPSDNYRLLIGEISLAFLARDRNLNLRPDEPPKTAAQIEPQAQVMVNAICWLQITDPEATQLPAGKIRTEFTNILKIYLNEPEEIAGCAEIPAKLSDQAQQLFERDADLDGLSTPVELWFGTDENNSDTDNDGFSDAEEITNGYSPLKAD